MEVRHMAVEVIQTFMDKENSTYTIDKNIEAALESNISDTFTQGGNLSLNDLNSLEANEKAALKFAIECSHSVQDGIMNCADFETYLNERVKVSNKPISRFGCRFHVKSEWQKYPEISTLFPVFPVWNDTFFWLTPSSALWLQSCPYVRNWGSQTLRPVGNYTQCEI